MDLTHRDRPDQPNAPHAPVPVPVRLLPHGTLPEYATLHAAGCDLTASADLILRPGETRLLPLGFIMALPTDCEAQVRPRSGLSLKTSLRLPNTPGTIDADYRNEVGVILENTFNPASLPGLIAARPDLLSELLARYRLVRLADLLPANGQADPGKNPGSVFVDAVPAETTDHLVAEYLAQPVWIDGEGLPYGTIRIRRGERIAQMVVTGVRRAAFDLTQDPSDTGHDRGGGFGSTGLTGLDQAKT